MYDRFPVGQLKLKPLAERKSLVLYKELPKLGSLQTKDNGEIAMLAERMKLCRDSGKPIVWMIGGHVIKQGLLHYLHDLMKQGWISHLAMNGSAMIHDYELVLHGATSESVPANLPKGEFGMWQELDDFNRDMAGRLVMGRSVGQAAVEVATFALVRSKPKRISVLAATTDYNVPVSVHTIIGGDINHMLKSFCGESWGRGLILDQRFFATALSKALDGGMYLNVGSAVIGPEIFQKALSMCLNIRQKPVHLHTAVFDLMPIPQGTMLTTLTPDQPLYYFRPLKTILQRALLGGMGTSQYICGDHRLTIPTLWKALQDGKKGKGNRVRSKGVRR